MPWMLSLSLTPSRKLGSGELCSILPSCLTAGTGGFGRTGTDNSSLPSQWPTMTWKTP